MMTTQVFGKPSKKRCPKRFGSVATFISCGTLWTICRAKPMMICLQELRWIYDRRDAPEARRDLAAWLTKWGKRYGKLCGWVEENIEETLSFYRLPRQHHKNMKSTNMLERLMEEIKRRTLVVRIFPNAAACLRLVRALPVEIDENWIEAMQYLNMEPLVEQKKEALRNLGDAA